MKAIKYLLLTGFLVIFFSFASFAQANVKELKIGDKLPKLSISSIVNQEGKQLSLNEFSKEKLLIINFWATWCVPCIGEIRFLDSLLKEHPDEFRVVMVTYQDMETVQKFLSLPKNKNIDTKNIVIATGDTLLRKLFPHTGIPHNVWVDSRGTIKSITGGEELTKDHLLNFNSIDRERLRLKKDNLNFDPTASRFNLGDTSFIYRSIIAPSIKGVNGGGELYVPEGDKIRRFFMWRGTLMRAYWCAYSKFNVHMRPNLMEIHTKDSLKFFTPTQQYTRLLKNSNYKNLADWEDEHSYFYDLSLSKPVSDTTFRNYMFQDLERQFNVKAKIETRKIPCVVVTKRYGRLSNETSETGHSKIEMLPNYKLVIKRSTIDDLLNFLFTSGKTADFAPDPFLNEARSWNTKRFDAVLDLSAYVNPDDPVININMIFDALEPYGFTFKKENRNHPILVLYDQQ